MRTKEVADICGVTEECIRQNAKKVGRIAREQNLKQEPIYGKLGKIQLKNGRWCDVFYYNDDAKLVIENNL